MAKIFIGTSGWQYRGWKNDFYPDNLPQKRWLTFYSRKFNTVEVNSSFYRQTKAKTFKKWLDETPKEFVFSVKGNRFITHIKKLKDCKKPVNVFFENANVLTKERTKAKHVVLWQLPPNLKKDLGRFKTFLSFLPERFSHAFEFRDDTWISKEVFEVFKNSKLELSVVLQDWHEWPVVRKPIGKFVYLRFHGRKKLYTSNYSDSELEVWAKRMQEWKDKGHDIYAYFNNDALGNAHKNALKLKSLTQ